MYSYPSFGKSTSNATSSKDLPPFSEMRRYSLLIATKENHKARVINIHLFPLRLFQWKMMHDAWSMFHSLRCIMGASLVNYVPSTSLETKTANATDASMLCQQNVKTMYFQALNPRLFKSVIWFWFCSVVIYANEANFQQVCLARARGNFGWS